MPEVEIQIGGRAFDVACQDGEEHYLLSAAKMLDEEASVLAAQIGRLPEARMLLMAGLMLADKTAGLEDKVREQEAELEKLRNQPKPAPERIEVPTIPVQVTDSFAEIAARAEAIAARLDEKTARA